VGRAESLQGAAKLSAQSDCGDEGEGESAREVQWLSAGVAAGKDSGDGGGGGREGGRERRQENAESA